MRRTSRDPPFKDNSGIYNESHNTSIASLNDVSVDEQIPPATQGQEEEVQCHIYAKSICVVIKSTGVPSVQRVNPQKGIRDNQS